MFGGVGSLASSSSILPWTTRVSLSRNWDVDSRLRTQDVAHSTSQWSSSAWMHLHPNTPFFTYTLFVLPPVNSSQRTSDGSCDFTSQWCVSLGVQFIHTPTPTVRRQTCYLAVSRLHLLWHPWIRARGRLRDSIRTKWIFWAFKTRTFALSRRVPISWCVFAPLTAWNIPIPSNSADRDDAVFTDWESLSGMSSHMIDDIKSASLFQTSNRRGVVVDLERDWLTMNIPFWIFSNIPVFYQWTERVAANPRFQVLSPHTSKKSEFDIFLNDTNAKAAMTRTLKISTSRKALPAMLTCIIDFEEMPTALHEVKTPKVYGCLSRSHISRFSKWRQLADILPKNVSLQILAFKSYHLSHRKIWIWHLSKRYKRKGYDKMWIRVS